MGMLYIIERILKAKLKIKEEDKITLEFKDDIDRTFSLRVLMENNLIILIK